MKRPLFIYASYLPAATVTAGDTAAGLDPADVLSAEEDNVWKPADTAGAKTLTVDLGALQELGALGIVGEHLNGVTLEVRGSTDGFAASDIQLGAPAVIDGFITCWRAWSNAGCRQIRLVFTGVGPSFCVAHVALSRYDLLPFFDDGMDADAFRSEATQLVSPDGHYLGSNRLRTMRAIDIIPGKMTDAVYLLYQRWAEACVHQLRPFFLVPDSGQSACCFVWLSDPKWTFKAPRKAGVRTMAAIPVTARIP